MTNSIAPIDRLAISFCADRHYIAFAPAAIESILRHYDGSRGLPFFHLVTDVELNSDTTRALEDLCSGHYKVHVIDASVFDEYKEVTHISRAMYYRLLLPSIISERRVLYLDCDVLVRKDLSSLASIDMSGNIVGAVRNPFYDVSRIGFADGDIYFNSGVLLIDRALWVAHLITPRTRSYIEENMQSLWMPDQDALNFILRNKWLELDPTFNCQTSMFVFHQALRSELSPTWQTDFLEDPAIVHFSSGHKQWHTSCRSIYSSDYISLKHHKVVPRKGPLLDAVISLHRLLKYWKNPYFT